MCHHSRSKNVARIREMYVQCMTTAGVIIAWPEDEDPVEYFATHEEVGEFGRLPLLTMPTTTRLGERRRRSSTASLSVEFTKWWTCSLSVKKRRVSRQARFVAKEWKSDEAIHNVFAPSSGP